MIDHLIKIFTVILIELVLSLLLLFVGLYYSGTIILVVGTVFLTLPILLSNNFLSNIIYGTLSGITQAMVFSSFENFLTNSLVYMVCGVLLGLSFFPYVRTKNPMFLVFLFTGIFLSFIIRWFFEFYDYNLIPTLQGLFYIFS